MLQKLQYSEPAQLSGFCLLLTARIAAWEYIVEYTDELPVWRRYIGVGCILRSTTVISWYVIVNHRRNKNNIFIHNNRLTVYLVQRNHTGIAPFKSFISFHREAIVRPCHPVVEESVLTLTGGIQDIAAILPLLDTYTRISLRSSNTYVYLRISCSSWGRHCGTQDFGCLLLIGGHWRGKDTSTWEWDSSRKVRIFC